MIQRSSWEINTITTQTKGKCIDQLKSKEKNSQTQAHYKTFYKHQQAKTKNR